MALSCDNARWMSPDVAWRLCTAARRDHGCLAAPAHHRHRRGGHHLRARRARRQSHDRHLAVAADRRPGRSWPGSGTCPSPPDLRTLSPGSPSLSTANQPRPGERPQIANPAPAPGLSACPLPGILGHHDHLPGQGSAHRAIRGIGSDIAPDQTNFPNGPWCLLTGGLSEVSRACLQSMPTCRAALQRGQ